jgi:acyl-CoA-binding protein
MTRRFVIHTDASDIAIGAILVQFDDDNNEYVVEYASEPLNGSKRNWTTTEKECYAVIYAIRHFKHYLYGTAFDVVTDHHSLRWQMSLRDPSGRLARWAAYLQGSTFNILHRKGILHSNVDAISRPVLTIDIQTLQNDSDDENVRSLKNDPHENSALMHYIKYKKCVSGSSNKQCKKVVKLATKYKLVGEKLLYFLFKENKYVIYPK